MPGTQNGSHSAGAVNTTLPTAGTRRSKAYKELAWQIVCVVSSRGVQKESRTKLLGIYPSYMIHPPMEITE